MINGDKNEQFWHVSLSTHTIDMIALVQERKWCLYIVCKIKIKNKLPSVSNHKHTTINASTSSPFLFLLNIMCIPTMETSPYKSPAKNYSTLPDVSLGKVNSPSTNEQGELINWNSSSEGGILFK